MTNSIDIAVVVPAYNEEKLIRETLQALSNQKTDSKYHVVVVDNGSTDNTPEIVLDFPEVSLLQEARKGTGFAANRGFRHVIAEDNPLAVMRTDADTVPSPNWVEAAKHYLTRNPEKQLISGLVRPLRDEYYRRSDKLLLPASYVAYRLGVTVLKHTLWPLRVARGGNMAIRPEAFYEVDGFPNCSIEQEDDDLELTKRIYGAYGLNGLGNVRAMEVRTSMRRIRRTGWFGLLNYYLNFTSKPISEVREQMTGGNIDIR
ncbi:glycosyltransferase family 2 protein [Candidatus Nomurabacteria bacterium]|nr:glycosyltransferase family 2 protein [Candidatus Nomurabacteria bacterium]